MRDYEIHLNFEQISGLFDPDEESEGHPFYEDPDEIDRIISEEIGKPRGRRKRKQR